MAESLYFSVPGNIGEFASHWSDRTSVNYSDFMEKRGALAYLELSYAWLTHCSIKGAHQRRDFSSHLISEFEKFLFLDWHDRAEIYRLLLDAALGNSRTNRLSDFRAAWESATEDEKNSDHINKLGWAAERFEKHAHKYFYPLYLNIGGESHIDSEEMLFGLAERFLEFVISEEDLEAYIKYMLMCIYLDIFDMEKSFHIFQDGRIQRLAVVFDITELFTLAKRLLAIGWRDEAIYVTEFSTNYAFAEKMDLPFIIGEAEKLRKLTIEGRIPTIRPAHATQFENIKRLSRR